MSEIKLSIVSYDQIKDDIQTLIQQHWNEVGYDHEGRDLDPDWEKYQLLNDTDMLSIAVAFNSDGTLIGYCVDIFDTHIHHRTLKYAVNDIFYVHPTYRKSHVPMEILNFVGEYLHSRGVKTHMLTMMECHKYERLAEAAGYTKVETTWAKDFGSEE